MEAKNKVMQSRGYKTKGNTYKDRYVEKECPECSYPKAYRDTWRTKFAFTCQSRQCRHKWYGERCVHTGEEK